MGTQKAARVPVPVTQAAATARQRRRQPEKDVEEAGQERLETHEHIGNRSVVAALNGVSLARIVDDAAPGAGRGQMRKSEFLATLRASVDEVTDELLAHTGNSAADCPWIAHWFSLYEDRPAVELERLAARFGMAAAGAPTAEALIGAVTAQVRNRLRTWIKTGEMDSLPEGTPASVQAAARNASRRRGPVARGQAVPPALRTTVGNAFGDNLNDVRLHTGPKAADFAARRNAAAVTVGRDVWFAAGQYRPGTPVGDALIAHELAHAVQQSGALQPRADPPEPAIEADASRAAAAALGGVVARARPVLRTGLRLSRCSSDPPTDYRAGTSLPDATRLAALRRELRPTSTSSSGAPLIWDGGSAAPFSPAVRAANRANLQTDLTAAMIAYLNGQLANLAPTIAARRLPMTSFEGAGRAAKAVVDTTFAPWTSAAALTAPQAAERHGFQFRGAAPGQTLFDAYDPVQRSAAGHPIDPVDLANWISETAPDAVTEKESHNFDPNRGGEEETFLTDEIIDPFVAAHEADLRRFDQFGFAISGDRIVAPSAVQPGMSDVPGSGGRPSPAERRGRWDMWQLLVHEYIHKLEHPAFTSATGTGNRIMTEGFCELFTKEVLLRQIPRAPGNRSLRVQIEGGDYGEPPAGTVRAYSPGDYASYLAHAEAIRDTVIGGRGGDNAVKAAFFQGHVEFIGLTPSGVELSPVPPGSAGAVGVPSGITTIDQLATAANVKASQIRSANPGVPAAGPLPASMRVPGAREHIVVEATDASGSVAETRAQIAKQNGVSEAALNRANPAITWGALTAGDRILIPRH